MIMLLKITFILMSLMSFTLAFDGEEKDSSGCPKVFQNKCHCGPVANYKYWTFSDEKEVYIVNCTNQMFKDAEMLKFLPSETQVLIFVGNQIPRLDWNLFGIWDAHKNLKIVDMTNNQIKDILGKSYHRVGYVKRLILDHNDLIISGSGLHPKLFSNFYNLEELHLTNTFTETIDSKWYLSDLKEIFIGSNLTKLKKLHLEQNEIWKIEDQDMFCDLPALTELYLGDNQLQSVDFSLDCLKQLTHLGLRYNKIRRPTTDTLNKLDALSKYDKKYNKKTTIDLSGNPFHCDCNLKHFFTWLRNTNTSVLDKDSLICWDGYPISNAGKSIINLKTLDCGPQDKKANAYQQSIKENPNGSSVFTQVLLVILIIVVLSGMALLVMYQRKKISESLRPVINNFQKSMQYRTIEKDDAPQEVNV